MSIIIFYLFFPNTASAYSEAWMACMNKCVTKPSEGKLCDKICTGKTRNKRNESNSIDYDGLARAGAKLSKGIAHGNDQPVKQTDYKCFSSCTSHGHEYDFCHSKCDY